MQVFVSYAESSTEIGHRLVERLREAGVEATSYNIRVMRSTLDEVGSITRELNKFDYLIVLWSKEYADDPWLQKELFAALSVETERKRPFVVPVCVDDYPLHSMLANRNEILYYEDQEAAFDRVAERIPAEDQIFMVMAFNDSELDLLYERFVKSVAAEFGFDVVRADEEQRSTSISDRILRLIHNSPVVLCELTGERPNVYFETGYAYAMNREVILSCKMGSKVHFDISGLDRIEWTSQEDFAQKLRSRLSALRSRRLNT